MFFQLNVINDKRLNKFNGLFYFKSNWKVLELYCFDRRLFDKISQI